MPANIRYSRQPVEIGQVRYVGCDGSNEVAAHVVTTLETPMRVWDDAEQVHVTM